MHVLLLLSASYKDYRINYFFWLNEGNIKDIRYLKFDQYFLLYIVLQRASHAYSTLMKILILIQEFATVTIFIITKNS